MNLVSKRGSTQRAWTIAECLVSILVLAMLGGALCPAMCTGYRILRAVREDLRATEILTQKMEAVRLLSWGDLSNCPTSFQEYYYPPGVSSNTAGVVYSGTIAIGAATNISNTASYQSNIKLITVSLQWTNGGGTGLVHNVQMQTLSAQSGMQNYIWGYRP